MGKSVTTFSKGDTVFGFNDKITGGDGEYLTIAETFAVTNMPGNVNFNEAAAITEEAHHAILNNATHY
jgi:NADPH:quinone reductase-like Zn-dependent oxidoreductase